MNVIQIDDELDAEYEAAKVLRKYPKVVVAEQNMGQFAMYLRSKVEGVHFNQFNQVKGQPFVVNELVEAFTNLLKA